MFSCLRFSNRRQALSRLGCRVTALCLIQALLWIVFRDHIAPMGAPGMHYSPTSGEWTLASGVIVIGLASALFPARVDTAFSAAAWVLYLLLVVPGWVMLYSLGMDHLWWRFAAAVMVPVLLLGVAARRQSESRTSRPDLLDGQSGSIIAVCLVVVACVVAITGWQADLSFSQVYSRRLEFREHRGDVIGYAATSVEHGIIPVLITAGLCSRRWGWVIAALLGVFIPYLTYGSKVAVIAPLILVGYWSVRRCLGGRSIWLVGMSLISMVTVLAWNSNALNDSLVRRALCVPTVLSTHYLEYFSESEPLYWRDSQVVSGLFHQEPVADGAGYLIGAFAFHSDELNASVNVFINGFAECRLTGAWMVGLVIAVLLRAFDRLVSPAGPDFAALLGMQLGMQFATQALHTAILSGGVAVTGLLCWWLIKNPSARHQCRAP